MRRLGSLSGVGKLRGDDGVFGDVNYSIVVWRDAGGIKGANGSMSSSGNEIIKAAFSNKKLFLDLENGGSASILITSSSGKKGEFAISGPVPGY